MHSSSPRSASARLPHLCACSGLLCALLSLLVGCAAPRTMLIGVPVTDLRAEPNTVPQADIHDPLQESQVIYGERVRVLTIEDGWAKIQALEQPEFTHAGRWQGYPGWIPEETLQPLDQTWKPNLILTAQWTPVWPTPYRSGPVISHLPLGTYLSGVSVGGHLWRLKLLDGSTGWILNAHAQPLWSLQQLPNAYRRRLILRTAERFIGDPYFWGGRSPYTEAEPARVTGVDCSGLVNLAYRSVGIRIPRDAHEQFVRAQAVETLQPADLIFLSEPADPSRIVHVMLYAGNGEVIEGPGTGKAVRRIALERRFDIPEETLTPGAVVDGQTVSFGTYFRDRTVASRVAHPRPRRTRR